MWGGIPLSKVRTTGRGGRKFKVRDQDLENPTRKVTTWRDGAAIPCPKLGQGRSRAGQQRSGEIDAAQARGEVGTCVPPPWPRPSSPRRQGTASIWMMRAALSQTIVPDRSSSAMAELNFVLAASSPCRGSGERTFDPGRHGGLDPRCAGLAHGTQIPLGLPRPSSHDRFSFATSA